MKQFVKTMGMSSIGLLLGIGILGASLTGCATVSSGSNAVKGEAVAPAADAGFIKEPERQSKPADLPFHKIWIKADFDKSSYRELYVAPVNTEYMLKMDWLHKSSSANWFGGVKKDIDGLAVYFLDRVVKDLTKDPNHRFQIIETPVSTGQPALSLELALIEIDPSQPVLHAAGWAVPGGTVAAGAVNQRRAAFEGRLRDMDTVEVVATFADRDMADAGPLDLTRLTWYGPAKGIMDRWVAQFVQIANRKPWRGG
ncbi:MAG: DUF3313 family protein, partial [Betaproteobacteria bacterium]